MNYPNASQINEKNQFAGEIYHEVIERVSKWMRETYPDLNKSLSEKILNASDKFEQLDKYIKKYKKALEEDQEKFINSCKEEIKKVVIEEVPELLSKMKATHEAMNIIIDRVSKKEKIIDEKLKKTKTAESLSKDVYQMRDEFENIKKQMDDLMKRLKGIFK